MQRTIAVLAAVGATVVAWACPVSAVDKPTLDQCVVHVVGEKASGEYVLSEPHCYATFSQAMSAEGVDAWGTGASVKARRLGLAAAASFTLATHFDGGSYGGASTSTVGDDCGGGWLNTNSSWDNRISSTLNGCPRVRHYDGDGLTGSFETTTGGGGNLGPLNNRTNSIQYLT